MKKKFEQPESSVVRFIPEDVITTSGGPKNLGFVADYNNIENGEIDTSNLGKIGN